METRESSEVAAMSSDLREGYTVVCLCVLPALYHVVTTIFILTQG